MGDVVSFGKKGSRMSAIALEMQRIVRSAAEPVAAGESIKTQMRRSWAVLKRPDWWRLRAAWYGEAGCWSAEAVDDLRRRDAERRRKEEAGRAKAERLGQIFAATAARLAQTDADFHSDTIAQLVDAARALGLVDRAVAPGDDD